MIVTTTDSIDGKSVTKHLGIVAGEAIMGANMFKDLFAGIRDLVGGRSQAYEGELEKGRNLALEDMKEQAKSLGANAVIGVDIDYQVLGQNNSMLMVSVNGTAVEVQ